MYRLPVLRDGHVQAGVVDAHVVLADRPGELSLQVEQPLGNGRDRSGQTFFLVVDLLVGNLPRGDAIERRVEVHDTRNRDPWCCGNAFEFPSHRWQDVFGDRPGHCNTPASSARQRMPISEPGVPPTDEPNDRQP